MSGAEENEAEGAPLSETPRVVVLRKQPVILAADVARAFGVETREVAQAIKRNPLKFHETHAFQPTPEELEVLRSQGVISGKGWTPTLLTQKGVVRLATVLNSPKAIIAVDEMIDLFVHVYAQLREGSTTVNVEHPSRLVPQEDDVAEIRKLRRRVVKAIGTLLDTTIDPKRNTTVGEALGETATSLKDHLNAWLKMPQIKNEQIAAETLKVIEQTRDIYERRQSDLKRTSAETERLTLENVKTKIELVEKLLAMTDKLEPGTLAQVLPYFQDAQLALPSPPRASKVTKD
ncbi:MAG: ORF6N domain-containing protein [Hyphomicrobium sp.]|jgi:hypothetical protein